MIAKNTQEKHMNKERFEGRNQPLARPVEEIGGKTFRIRTPEVEGQRERATGKVRTGPGDLKHELKNV